MHPRWVGKLKMLSLLRRRGSPCSPILLPWFLQWKDSCCLARSRKLICRRTLIRSGTITSWTKNLSLPKAESCDLVPPKLSSQNYSSNSQSSLLSSKPLSHSRNFGDKTSAIIMILRRPSTQVSPFSSNVFQNNPKPSRCNTKQKAKQVMAHLVTC